MIINDDIDEVMQIGGVVDIVETGSMSIANNTVTAVANKVMSAGLYLVNFIYNWKGNSSGIREIIYNSSSTAPLPSPSRMQATSAAAHAGDMYHNGSIVMKLPAKQTVYFWAYQNSGSTLELWPFIKAVLLKA